MKVITFTDKMVDGIKPTDKKQYKSEGNGFTVRIMPTGAKAWLYRYDFDGRRRELHLGVYPEVALKEARSKFGEARKKVKNGIDVVAVIDNAKQERKLTPTVSQFAEEYYADIEQHPKYKIKTWEKVKHTINKEILPSVGGKKVTDIKPRDLLAITDKIVDRGALVMANRVFAFASMLMNHAVEKRVVAANPFAGMKRPGGKEEARERNLSEGEVKTLWAVLDDPKLSITSEIRRALKLVLVTCQRPGEVIGMHVNELSENWWTIPKERSKNGREQRVYLTATALSLIGDTKDKGYIFKAAGKTEKPMTQPAMNYALRRQILSPVLHKGKPVYGADGKPVTENLLGVDSLCPHDLRRTGATMISKLGFSDEIIDALLNHKKQGVIKSYNMHRYDLEKQQALEALERKILSVLQGTEGNVIPINRKMAA